MAGILIPSAIFVRPDGPYLGILIGTLLVSLLGLWDDIHGIQPSTKLLGVCLVAPSSRCSDSG